MSRRRRKYRGQRPPALMTFDRGEIVAGVENADNPRTRRCTHCRATPGDPCTRPGPGGTRIEISGYHDCRKTQEQP